MTEVFESEEAIHLRDRADHWRSMAKVFSDPRTVAALLDLAADLERKAARPARYNAEMLRSHRATGPTAPKGDISR
jgi:hypothetical protein